ncbi:hypothetical protein Tco_0154468 [Tanacetum coccineum]
MYNSPKQSGVILPSKWYTSPKQSGILLPRKWYTSPKQMAIIGNNLDPEEVQLIMMRRMLTLFTRIREDQEDDGDKKERDTLEIRMLYNLLIPTTLTQPQPPNKIYVTPEHRLLNHLEKLLEDQVLNVADRSMKRPYPTRDLEEPKDSLVPVTKSEWGKINFRIVFGNMIMIWRRIRRMMEIKEDVIQPLIPTTLHTTPSNEDYVAPATKPILKKLLEDKILNVAMVDEEADPTRDLEEPERLLVE